MKILKNQCSGHLPDNVPDDDIPPETNSLTGNATLSSDNKYYIVLGIAAVGSCGAAIGLLYLVYMLWRSSCKAGNSDTGIWERFKNLLVGIQIKTRIHAIICYMCVLHRLRNVYRQTQRTFGGKEAFNARRER